MANDASDLSPVSNFVENASDEELTKAVRAAFNSCKHHLQSSSNGKNTDDDRSGSNLKGALPFVSLAPETRLGDFVVLSEIGRGGMGVVYRACQRSVNREVALKVLPRTVHRGRSSVDRFRNEAQAIARLNHPHIVRIYAHGEDSDHLYHAMELIHGQSLDHFIHQQRSSAQRTSQDFQQIARWIAEAADGLAHAHMQSVIHRDIKPQNLLLGEDGRLRITDFGLAHLTDEPHVTVTGEIMGTPAYLSPEQIRGDSKTIDRRTDVYSLGITLYELITLRPPFEGKSRDRILHHICLDDPPPPRRLDTRIPRDLETICLRAIEKNPSDRYDSAVELAEDLRRFSDGVPVRARRIGPLSRAVRWAKRHKAKSIAIAAVAVVILLGVGLAGTVRAARRDEGDRLIQDAYEQLILRNYHKPELVMEKIKQARKLGCDPLQLAIVEALAEIGADQNKGPVKKLEDILTKSPGNIRVLYMLARVKWHHFDYQGSREAFDEAERLGGAKTPDEWFLRGLAAHFDRPKKARESYRQAIALDAEFHSFYPQAILHLARAYNQDMYTSRSLEHFERAEGGLRQLIEHGYYEAYPHYLLSITYRLAGEIESASGERNAEDTAVYHYAEALSWAREGQSVSPNDERPVTAEAECLEKMYQFERAADARTRAIDLASHDRRRWAGFHYRWRLNYWMGQFDNALEDLATCAGFAPDNIFYANVYPALVRAEMGDLETAIAKGLEIADSDPEDSQRVIWAATTLRLLGATEAADALLAERINQVNFTEGLVPPQTEKWVEALYGYSADQLSLERLLDMTQGAEPPRKLTAEAYFHAGAKALSSGNIEVATGHFTDAYLSFDSETRYTYHARIILEKLKMNPEWPIWIGE